MRLLECKGNDEFSLTKDLIDEIPAYAILSHTWGDDEQEVTFKDLVEGTGQFKAGYRKIRFCGKQAARDGLRYFWIDTCCIDKTNNNELSEAINSMFYWYRESARCYVYLSDVSSRDSKWESAFRKSRWLTRGWTLQELIAPFWVIFFSEEGRRLGDKKSLKEQLTKITGIPVDALQGGALASYSVKSRISWAKNRETKRKEDKAYSLLGMFDIHMPLIYGEGRENAFIRLREQIEKSSKRSETSAVKHSSAALKEVPKEQDNTKTQSPSWLKPVVMMPSQDFKSNVQAIDPAQHPEFAEVIFSNCKVACFGFYCDNRLWRTRYSMNDVNEPKLFQLDTGTFPKSAADLTLRDWLSKISRSSRLPSDHSFTRSDVYDWSSRGDLFDAMTTLCALTDPWGRLNIENVEEHLLLSLRICRHLNSWDSFGRLAVLWNELHKPYTDVHGPWRRLDLDMLKPPLSLLPVHVQ